MNDRDERQMLLKRLKEIGVILNALSEQNAEATKAGDWGKAQQVQKETSEMTELQTSLIRQLRQLPI